MIAKRLSSSFFSVAKAGRTMLGTKNTLPTETVEEDVTPNGYVPLKERVNKPERTHPRVETFQQHTRRLAIKVMEHVNLCAMFVGQSTEEMHTHLKTHRQELETLWETIEAEQRMLLNDSSLERFHREQLERYSKTASNLYLVSRIGVHLNRFVLLAEETNVFIARTPLAEATQEVLQGMVPVVESLLRDAPESAQQALGILEAIQQKHQKTLCISSWRTYLPDTDLRLLQASFHALAIGGSALQAIAKEHSTALVPTLAGRAVNSHDLLRPLK
jgi:hypothetical protein